MIESDYNKKKVEIAQTSAVSESTEASKETEKEEHAKAVDEAIQKELNPSSGKSSEVKGNTDYCIEDKISEAKEKATQVKQSEFGLTGKESSTTGAIAKDASLKEDVKPTSDKSNFSDLKKRIDSFASKVEAYGKNLDSIEKENELISLREEHPENTLIESEVNLQGSFTDLRAIRR